MSEDLVGAFNHLKKLSDTGDILGVKGTIKRTEKGELSVYVSEFQILTKSLLPLPDKWHGLTDTEKRYRQRYVDLIVNPQVRQTFRIRAKITAAIRRYLETRDFLEIETPVLQSEAGGAESASLCYQAQYSGYGSVSPHRHGITSQKANCRWL